MDKVLGIIAGGGKLPCLVIEACRDQGRPFFILAYEGQTPKDLVQNHPHVWLTLGEVGKAFEALKKANVSHVVMTGAFQRPPLSTLKTDWLGARLLARMALKARGDHAMMHMLMQEIEARGLTVVSPQCVLECLKGPVGGLGQEKPSPQAHQDIAIGLRALNHISSLDIGQALVIQQGLILGVEGAEGTDQLIIRCSELAKEGEGPILIKAPKAHQDRRVDPPVLGPTTLEHLIRGGFQGVAYGVPDTLLLFQHQLKQMADDAGLFIEGVECPPVLS